MDKKFDEAVDAMKASDAARFREILRRDPTLATSRSSKSHPTLLRCVVLDAIDSPALRELVAALIDAGAEIDEPLVASCSMNNVVAAEMLLDAGAAIDGNGGWSPLEEALYWRNLRAAELLLRRGASLHNLRIAAGLGRIDVMETFFNADGSLKPEAGGINWPWGGAREIEHSNLDSDIRRQLASKVASWTHDRQSVVDNALIYACMHDHVAAAEYLLKKGARINAIADGFDFSGTALHYAALHGHRAMVEFLLANGADANIRDPKVGGTPAGWADHGGHAELRDFLQS